MMVFVKGWTADHKGVVESLQLLKSTIVDQGTSEILPSWKMQTAFVECWLGFKSSSCRILKKKIEQRTVHFRIINFTFMFLWNSCPPSSLMLGEPVRSSGRQQCSTLALISRSWKRLGQEYLDGVLIDCNVHVLDWYSSGGLLVLIYVYK